MSDRFEVDYLRLLLSISGPSCCPHLDRLLLMLLFQMLLLLLMLLWLTLLLQLLVRRLFWIKRLDRVATAAAATAERVG